MKREIKFRFFDLLENKMIKYPIDGISQNPFGKSLSDNLRPIISINGDMCFPNWGRKCITMQFTGLLDKKGIKIYEGDIINYIEHKGYLMNSFIGEVVWLDNHSAFGYKVGLNEHPFNSIDEIQYDLLNHTEVIGNIYENSELTNNG